MNITLNEFFLLFKKNVVAYYSVVFEKKIC